MATLPFRPPQFSNDVAWLPPWLQPNYSPPSTSQNVVNEDVFLHSLQKVDPFDAENRKDSNLSTIGESRHKICHLYLSGDESSPVTLTPSSEKVLHFNLHLSTGGTSSTVSNPLLQISQDDKLNSILGLVGTREKTQSQCNKGQDSSKKMNIVPSPSGEMYPGCSANQTPFSNDPGQNTVEILNSKCAECSDIIDAVKLSVAASEALAIHDVSQSESLSEALSTSSVLEVALRVKQSRLDGWKDSLCCFKDSGNIADTLSDLDDSDMEDAYKDVGLSVSISLTDPSTSRVKETPMSETHEEDKEVQSEWQGDHEILCDRSFATVPMEKILERNKLNDIFDNEKLENLCRNPSIDLITDCQTQNGISGDLPTVQEETNDITYADGFLHQVQVKSSSHSQHSRKTQLDSISTIRHSRFLENEVNDRSSSRFQSRWLGGWTGMERNACDGLKSKGRKTIPKLFTGETSYISESMDVFPDQHSVVHNHPLSSNASESGKLFEDSCKIANKCAYLSQEVVKDSTSCTDPLCSMVPCSISVEIDASLYPTTNGVDHQLVDAFKNLPSGTDVPMEIAQSSSDHNDEYVGGEKHDELDFDDVGPYPLIRRRFTSLRTFSTGLPGNFSSRRNHDCEFVSLGENDTRELSDNTNCPNGKDPKKQTPVRSTSKCATAKSKQEDQETKLLSVEPRKCCPNTSVKKVSVKQPPTKSIFSYTTATNSKDNDVENACGRLIQDHPKRNAENGVEPLVHLKDIPTSPLVLCHRTRRFKAPLLHAGDISTANVSEDQPPSSVKTHSLREIPQGQCNDLPKSAIPARKRVRFSDADFELQIPRGQLNTKLRTMHNYENWSSCRLGDRPNIRDLEQGVASQEVKERLTKCRLKGRKRTIFQGLDFLLTGFSKKKEKEIEGILRKHGGMVLSDIPAPLPHPRRRRSLRLNTERLPVVLCTKKLQTTRFLYGCAVNAFLLKVGWVYESIKLGSVLPPDKYLIISNQTNSLLNQIGKSICQHDNDYIFDKVGIMLQGTLSFFAKLAKVIKHGQGHVYKSLQWLVKSLEKKKIAFGVIVTEDENHATRHLKKCASEQNIAVVSVKWITNSLFEGKLLPLKENYQSSKRRAISVPEVSVLQECSQEI